MKNSTHPQTVPPFQKIQKGKHFLYNIYSITVRDGCGVDLGVKPHSDFISYIVESSEYYVISVEKFGKASHFQVGAIFPSPVRQDVLRSDIIHLYEPLNWNESQRKYAVEVKPHHDPEILFKYCVKESYPLHYKGWIPYKQLIGCFCYTKYMICKACDPHKEAWRDISSKIPYPLVYHTVWRDYELRGYRSWFRALKSEGLLDVYGPLIPAPIRYIRPILPDFIETESISEPERCSVALPSPEEGGVRSNERSLSDF